MENNTNNNLSQPDSLIPTAPTEPTPNPIVETESSQSAAVTTTPITPQTQPTPAPTPTPQQTPVTVSVPVSSPTPTPAPLIPESEMKLPEESFGNMPTPEPTPSRSFNPLFIILLVLLLGLLGAVIIWGEQIIDLILPNTNMEIAPLTETENIPNNEQRLNELETELNNIDINQLDSRLTTIETNINSELATGTVATSTATTTQ